MSEYGIILRMYFRVCVQNILVQPRLANTQEAPLRIPCARLGSSIKYDEIFNYDPQGRCIVDNSFASFSSLQQTSFPNYQWWTGKITAFFPLRLATTRSRKYQPTLIIMQLWNSIILERHSLWRNCKKEKKMSIRTCDPYCLLFPIENGPTDSRLN